MSTKYKVTAKGRIAPNGYRLCDPLKVGDRLYPNDKKEWVIGKSIGAGGFGEVYLCHPKGEPNNQYVVKVDNPGGPIYVEMHFMIRVCKDTVIDEHKRKRKLDFLGIPRLITFGLEKDIKRYLIMDRLGEELDAVLNRSRVPIDMVCRITCRIIDSLEFIHENGYIHADIKSANILRRAVTSGRASTSRSTPARSKRAPANDVDDDQFYLIDFGLAEKFLKDNGHRPYEEDERRANNGTREFRSRDAHLGVISRRSDMESLGFNLIIWLYGRHPWEPLFNCEHSIHQKKCQSMENIPQFLEEAFSDTPLPDFKPSEPKKAPAKRARGKAAAEKIVFERPERKYAINTTIPTGLDKYFSAVQKLQFDERPNYVALKEIIMSISKLNLPGSPTKRPLKEIPMPVSKPSPAVPSAKRPRHSTFLHDITTLHRTSRQSLVRKNGELDSDEDDKTNGHVDRRIYIAQNRSVGNREKSASTLTNGNGHSPSAKTASFTSPAKNSVFKSRLRSGSAGEDSKHTGKSSADSSLIDTVDQDLTDNDDPENDDEIPFAYRPRPAASPTTRPLVSNGRVNNNTTPSRETPHMIKLRQKLELKKSKVKARR